MIHFIRIQTQNIWSAVGSLFKLLTLLELNELAQTIEIITKRTFDSQPVS